MQNLIGTTLFANYGAGFPTYELTVQGVDDAGLLVCEGNNELGTVFVKIDSIRASRPTSGSPIGIYFNEMDAY